MNPATTHGAFSWSELITTDAVAATEFYAKILGYTVNSQDMGQGNVYHVLLDGETPRGGAMDRPDPNIPPHWGFYITVDDVDASAEKAKSLGAQEMWPIMDVPNVGRMAGFLDPQGAYFAIISYSYPPMDGPQPNFADAFTTHGAFSWFELRTPDPEAAKSFYTELFGWDIKPWPMGDDDMSYDTINIGETGVGGIIPPPAPGVPPHWGGYITVDDSDAVAAAAKAAGGSVVLTMDMPQVGRFHGIQDPQGAVVSVIKYYPPPDAE